MRDLTGNAAAGGGTVAAGQKGNRFRRPSEPSEGCCGQRTAWARCPHLAELIELRRDLHDQIGSSLVSIGLQLELARRSLPEQWGESSEALDRALADVSVAVEQVRSLCSAGRPSPAATSDLGAALRDLVTRLGGLLDGRIRIELRTTSGLGQLPPELASAALLIAQEALTNVVKHSGASWCRLYAGIRGDNLLLRVVDDGSGWPNPVPGTGSGLGNMRSRAREQGGDCMAGPAATGFAVSAWLPLRRADDPARPGGKAAR